MLNIYPLPSCSVKYLDGVSHTPVTEVVKNVEAYMNKCNVQVFVFTDNDTNTIRDTPSGDKLAKYIQKEGLGTITVSEPGLSAHADGTTVRIYTWLPPTEWTYNERKKREQRTAVAEAQTINQDVGLGTAGGTQWPIQMPGLFWGRF